MRPLDFLASIKLKLGVVIVAAVLLTVVVVLLGERSGLSAALTAVVAVALALGVVQALAHGMTRPLREMVGAARAMSRGDYERRVTATSRDEVGELARAFNRMAADLAEVDRVRRDLIANVSHELRTPLGSLRALLENLVDGIEQADSQTLATMLDQVERLGTLVEQLLDLSKLESGAVPLERAQIPAADLLERVAADWRASAGARGVVLQVVVEPRDLVFDADEARLHQVLGNLVANAVRHAPQGTEVTMAARSTPRGTELEVLDDGPGIPKIEAERVFERFYRSDHARPSGDGGSGLGLAIARWIVELHNGSIRTEERTPTGCRVVVELPR
ncbi:MAG: ATP-binding protein [Gaiellaceae bacterium]